MPSNSDADLEGIQIPVLWEGFDDADIYFVNQMIVQLGPPGSEGEFLMTLGQLHPPVLIGGEEANKAKLEALPYVTVKVVAKVGLPVSRARELRDLLTRMLETYDEVLSRKKK